MEVRDVKPSKKSLSPESVARLAQGEEPAEPVAYTQPAHSVKIEFGAGAQKP